MVLLVGVVVALVIGGAAAVFWARRSSRTRAGAASAGSAPEWGQGPMAPHQAWGQPPPAPPGWGQPESPAPPHQGWGPPGAGGGAPWTAPARGRPIDHLEIGPVVLVILGSLVALAFAAIALIGGLDPRESDGPDPGIVTFVGVVGLVAGATAAASGAMAWRGSAVGVGAGIGFGIVAGLLSLAAVVQPLPDLPTALSVPIALVTLAGCLYVVVAFLFAAPRRR